MEVFLNNSNASWRTVLINSKLLNLPLLNLACRIVLIRKIVPTPDFIFFLLSRIKLSYFCMARRRAVASPDVLNNKSIRLMFVSSDSPLN